MMDEPEHYWTQFAFTPAELDDLVNERIQEGWELFGDPYFATHPEKDSIFCQAVRRVRPKTKTMSDKIAEDLER
jgi:hypothetical protein